MFCVCEYWVIFFFFFLNNFFFCMKYGWTALYLAAFKGFDKVAKILVEYGPDHDLCDEVFWFSFFFFWFSFFFYFNFCFLSFYFGVLSVVHLLIVFCVVLMVCVIYLLFVFCSFEWFSLCSVWNNCSSCGCYERFWKSCEDSCWTWIQSSSSNICFLFFIFFFLLTCGLCDG